MNRRNNKICISLILAATILFIAAPPASALILHPDGDPNLAVWTDRPADDVIGKWEKKWEGKASCVAVSRNCIVTTRHQGGGAETPVKIAGASYSIAQIWNHDTADLRLVKLSGANLAEFVQPYTKTDESGKEIVIGGCGVGNGDPCETNGTVYGYEWGDLATRALRFGTNIIENPVSDSNLPPYISDIVVADFDDLSRDNPTAYECIPADHDSGGGWFIKDGDTWKLVALTRAVETHYEDGHEDDPEYRLFESWFRKPSNPIRSDADILDAVRISSYARWISDNLPEITPGDFTGDDRVDAADFAVFANFWQSEDCRAPDWCLGADAEPDGDIDAIDLAAFAQNWLNPI
jgi:hypothetical protein